MSETVGVAQLRQNLSKYLRRLERGERFVITDRNRPVGTLAPLHEHEDPYDRLVAEGKLIPARTPRIKFSPLQLDGSPLSQALREHRDEERW